MIKVQKLFKRFGDQDVLHGIDLEVQEGEILVILGESGSGKSVLLKHLVGLLKPDSGSVEINGEDITRLSERELLKVRKNIGFLFQDGALYDFMTVSQNVKFPLEEHSRLSSQEIEKQVEEMLKRVGLDSANNKFPPELSGGMRKRAALARAVILGTKVLFCDEPTSGLDPIKSRQISDLIHDIALQMHCTTVVTSHDIQNSLRIADRIVLIREGRIIAQGPPEELVKSSDQYLREFLN